MTDMRYALVLWFDECEFSWAAGDGIEGGVPDCAIAWVSSLVCRSRASLWCDLTNGGGLEVPVSGESTHSKGLLANATYIREGIRVPNRLRYKLNHYLNYTS